MDVPGPRNEVLIATNGDGMKPALERRSIETMAPVETVYVARAQPVHRVRQLTLLRTHKHVIVIAHQTIRMDLDAELILQIAQQEQEESPVLIIKENLLAFGPPIHQVVPSPAVILPQLSCHRLTVPSRCDTLPEQAALEPDPSKMR